MGSPSYLQVTYDSYSSATEKSKVGIHYQRWRVACGLNAMDLRGNACACRPAQVAFRLRNGGQIKPVHVCELWKSSARAFQAVQPNCFKISGLCMCGFICLISECWVYLVLVEDIPLCLKYMNKTTIHVLRPTQLL